MSRLLWADKSRDLVVYCRAEKRGTTASQEPQGEKGARCRSRKLLVRGHSLCFGLRDFACVLGLFGLLRRKLRLKGRELRSDVFGGFAFADNFFAIAAREIVDGFDANLDRAGRLGSRPDP